MSGLFTSVSAAFDFARTRSVLSVRTSMIVHVRSGERFLQTLITLLCVGRIEHADEDHDLAALRQRFFDELTSLASCRTLSVPM
jgi:hypothetical protein